MADVKGNSLTGTTYRVSVGSILNAFSGGALLRAPQHRTLQHQVLNEIGAEIVGGRWAPGESLPTEDELARLLGPAAACSGKP